MTDARDAHAVFGIPYPPSDPQVSPVVTLDGQPLTPDLADDVVCAEQRAIEESCPVCYQVECYADCPTREVSR